MRSLELVRCTRVTIYSKRRLVEEEAGANEWRYRQPAAHTISAPPSTDPHLYKLPACIAHMYTCEYKYVGIYVRGLLLLSFCFSCLSSPFAIYCTVGVAACCTAMSGCATHASLRFVGFVLFGLGWLVNSSDWATVAVAFSCGRIKLSDYNQKFCDYYYYCCFAEVGFQSVVLALKHALTKGLLNCCDSAQQIASSFFTATELLCW